MYKKSYIKVNFTWYNIYLLVQNLHMDIKKAYSDLYRSSIKDIDKNLDKFMRAKKQVSKSSNKGPTELEM